MESIINFISSHAVVLAAAGVAVLDLIFALLPSVQSNGILHWVYVFLKGKSAPSA